MTEMLSNRAYCIGFTALMIVICGVVAAEVPDQQVPTEVLDSVEPIMKDVRAAMEADDVKGVNVGVSKAITAIGKWSGVPETSTTYCPLINSKAFDIPKAREWWLAEIKRNLDKLPWKKSFWQSERDADWPSRCRHTT